MCEIRMAIFIIISVIFALPVSADDADNVGRINPILGLPTLNTPAHNPQNNSKIALGKSLFFDTRFSQNNTISCASCHQPDKAYSDGLARAIGINGKIGTRNTPTLINAAFFNTFFLDGRESSLEKQALKPMLNVLEHGMTDERQILAIVRRDATYKKQMQQAFAVSEQAITTTHIAQAIASFERTLIAGNAPFDRYYFARDKSQLSPSAARGLRVFRRKGNCGNCHEISWDNALFTDNRFYNIGVGFQHIQVAMDSIITRLHKNKDASLSFLSTKQRAELGRFNVTHIIADIGKFKTPTLRNIALTAPYMHDGSLQTLEQVVDYYNKGGNKNRFMDAAIFPLRLTTQEKSDLVSFLYALTSGQFATE